MGFALYFDFLILNSGVIGVFDYQGSAIGGPQYDDIAVLPTKFAQRFAKPTGSNASPSILINGHENVDINSLSYEVTRIMRSIRKLKPREKDDFALNKLTMVSDSLSQTFGMIDFQLIIESEIPFKKCPLHD